MYKFEEIAYRIEIKPFRFESATVVLDLFTDKVGKVHNLFSRTRGQGHAIGVMKKVIDYADEHDLYLYLTVQRYGYSDSLSLDNVQLITFYQKLGFNVTYFKHQLCLMERYPTQTTLS